MAKTTNNDGGAETPETPDTAPAPAVSVYELAVDGPIKIGGVIAYKSARLNLTKARADALNEQVPGALKWIGVP